MARKNKKVPIKYTSRDFNSIKQDLEDYARRYYPDTFRDFSEASFGALMVDSVAYIGDILSYYLDYNVNESFFDTAIEYNNVLRHARRLGYKYAGRASSSGLVALYAMVPANSLGMGPDPDYIPVLKAGTTISSKSGVGFILTENVNFSNSAASTVAARTNPTTGLPTFYAIRMYGRVVSGNYNEETFSVGAFERFKKIRISNRNFSEIISVFDSDGNQYFEVDYLSQNLVFKEFTNPNFATDNTPSILKPIVVVRRFTIERDSLDNVFMQFGYGSEEDISINQVADPSNVVINAIGKDYVSDANFDPYKLLNTDKFGVGPANTTLTISYRTNTATNVNVGAFSINSITRAIVEFPNPANVTNILKNSVIASIEAINEQPIIGDSTVPSIEEIKIRAKDYFASQNRAVTAQDYEALVYAMPGKFGSIKRCRILTDNASMRRNLNLYVVSEDRSTKLTNTSSTIKNNLKTWMSQHKIINDTIDILDAIIINLGIEFAVVSDQNVNKYDILEKCTSILKKEYNVKQLIGHPFEMSRIMKLLNKIDGVVDVQSVQIVLRTGPNYSFAGFPIESMKSPDGRYIMAPKNVIFEIKYPDADIRGSIK